MHMYMSHVHVHVHVPQLQLPWYAPPSSPTSLARPLRKGQLHTARAPYVPLPLQLVEPRGTMGGPPRGCVCVVCSVRVCVGAPYRRAPARTSAPRHGRMHTYESMAASSHAQHGSQLRCGSGERWRVARSRRSIGCGVVEKARVCGSQGVGGVLLPHHFFAPFTNSIQEALSAAP